MKDKNLLKISVITSIIGVMALFFLYMYIEPTFFHIEDIKDDIIGEKVKTSGLINSIRIYKENTFINLEEDGSYLKVVMFKNKDPIVFDLVKGQEIEVSGTVEQYKGELEIIASKIELI